MTKLLWGYGGLVVPEGCSCGKSHEDLILPPIWRDLSHLDETPAGVLLHVKVEPAQKIED